MLAIIVCVWCDVPKKKAERSGLPKKRSSFDLHNNNCFCWTPFPKVPNWELILNSYTYVTSSDGWDFSIYVTSPFGFSLNVQFTFHYLIHSHI